MKYLCLIYVDAAVLDETPDARVREVHDDCLAYCAELEREDRLIGCERLAPSQTATTVRTRGGDVSVVDGPFAETKEQLAGFYMIEARDLNEAIRVASRIPPACFGGIEVRPVSSGPSG